MVYPDTFRGFQIEDPKHWTDFKLNEITPKPFGDYDVDIKILACGVCASDLHTISGGWGKQHFPLCVGHGMSHFLFYFGFGSVQLSSSEGREWAGWLMAVEIVGTALRVGPKVTLIKPGERVGVGAQSYSCLKCRQCKADNETYCRHQLDTYGSVWPDTGIVSQGGYSTHVRTHEHWYVSLFFFSPSNLAYGEEADENVDRVFPIPAGLATNKAAPMLCAGLTAYSPLVRNGAGPGKKVGIVGMGGIGHFGLLFSKALGAETWVISRSHSKEADAKKMGADGFLATKDKDWNVPYKMTFDLIINTASSTENFDLAAYLSLLDVHGRWISVGLPEGHGQELRAQDLISNGCLIGASHLGSRKEVLAMLKLAEEKGIESWVEEISIGKEGLKTALTRLHDNDVRYRFTLTDYDKCFGAE